MNKTTNNSKKMINNETELKNNIDEDCRILAQDCYVRNEAVGPSNDLIIGPSGSGKTRGYVIPNLLSAKESSLVVVDPKGNLVNAVGESLEKRGYRIMFIDFQNFKTSTVKKRWITGWNPLEYVSYEKTKHAHSEIEIEKIARAISPVENSEPYWDTTAGQHLTLLLSIVLDFLPKEQHTLEYVAKLFSKLQTQDFRMLMEELSDSHPDHLSVRTYEEVKSLPEAERTFACVKSFLSMHLHSFTLEPVLRLYSNRNRIRFHEHLGQRKSAVFVSVSDTDRSLDPLISLFFSQAFHDLCTYADFECEGNRLPVPVRFILDDFGTNIRIDADFDKKISSFRSRGISVSIILQSVSQLSSQYDKSKANTILENCQNVLALGTNSIETAEYIGVRANIPVSDVFSMPQDEAILLSYGKKPKRVHKYDLTRHPAYNELPEAKAKTTISKTEEIREDSEAEVPTEKQSTDSAQSA